MLSDCCVCCQTSIFVGCVDPCGHLVSSSSAPERGEYRLEFDFAGAKKCVKSEVESGALISFPMTGLNESFQFAAKIYGPDGDQKQIEVSGQTYDCVYFKTSPGCHSSAEEFNLV